VATRVVLDGGDYDVFRRDELRAELDAIEPAELVELDLKKTTFMDAGAIGMLVAFRRRVREQYPDARIRLVHTPSLVRRVLKLSACDDLFETTS
jgi:anti-anti-sigma regulatory factor